MYFTSVVAGGGGGSGTVSAPLTLTVDDIRAVSTDASLGLLLVNSTDGTGAIRDQYSPMLVLEGQMWNAGAGESKEVQWGIQTRTTTALLVGTLAFMYNYMDFGYVDALTIAGQNSAQVGGQLTATWSGIVNLSTDAAVGLLMVNTTDATVGAQQQYSPMLVLEGQGWKTNATAASQEVQFGMQVIPHGGAANPYGELAFFANVNDSGFVKNMVLQFADTVTPNALFYLLRNSIGTATNGSDVGFILANAAVAASGNQQYSPILVWEGQGWKTDATAASKTVQFGSFVRPIQGAAAPTGELVFSWRVPTTSEVQGQGADSTVFGELFIIPSTGGWRADIFSLGAVSTDAALGALLLNSADAAAGAQQYSPMLVLEGQGWKTNATAATQEVQFGIQVTPVQAAANPNARLKFLANVNDSGFLETFDIFYNGASAAVQLLAMADGSVSLPVYAFNNDLDTGVILSGTNAFGLVAGGAEKLRVDGTSTAGQTALLIYDVDNNTLERVTVGAADSGGTNFKLLRIPN